ncbi:MAG: 23S rRNA (guanosine(2251)-2'-O)-methyltransferase RlmB [Gammaproteobacteria bacterium]|nr:23S rRNA (guanosine(2251)-2'-O)-methyltransferase RlmB [Gammaproteobacteria bacterium]
MFTYIYGIHTIQTALQKQPKNVIEIFISEQRKDQRIQQIIQLAEKNHIPIQFVSKETLQNQVGNIKHQNIIAKTLEKKLRTENDLDAFLDTLKPPAFLLILDGVQDPHNLGACLRTADAAGIQAVIVPKDQATGLTPVVRKVASGAAETVPLIQVTNLARTIRKLKDCGIWIVGADERADQTIFETELKGPIAIVLGAEGKGLRRLTKEHCDFLVKIPMQGTVSSLNVSVAAGVCLFETVRQRF